MPAEVDRVADLDRLGRLDCVITQNIDDLFIVVGSSLVVYPAALMPLYAKQAGAALVIVNLSETPHDSYADVLLRGQAGPVMEQVVELVKQRLALLRRGFPIC